MPREKGGTFIPHSRRRYSIRSSPVFNLLALCTCKTPAYRFLLEEFCLSPEWTLAPFWPVIDQTKLRKFCLEKRRLHVNKSLVFKYLKSFNVKEGLTLFSLSQRLK